jgi:hypothetical protein
VGFGNDYRDTQLARQIDVARFLEWENDRIAAFFDRLFKDITAKLMAFDAGGGNLHRADHLRELEKTFRTTLGEGYRSFKSFFNEDLLEMGISEEVFVTIAMDSIAGVPLINNALTPAWLRGIVTGQVVQGGPMSAWWQRQANGTQNQIMDAVRLGLTEGDSIADMVRRLRGEATGVGHMVLDPITNRVRWLPGFNGGVMGYSRRNAESITRTASMGIVADIRRGVYRANPDVVEGIVQISTLDGRTTEVCVLYDGEWWSYDGETGMIPRGPKGLEYNGGVPRHWGCRSTEAPKTPSWRDLGIPLDEIPAGTRRTMDGEVPENVTAAQWLRSKYSTDPGIVHGIFGKTKGDLWAQGRITDAEMISQNGRPLSLAEIVKRAGGTDGNHYTRILGG